MQKSAAGRCWRWSAVGAIASGLSWRRSASVGSLKVQDLKLGETGTCLQALVAGKCGNWKV